MLYAEKLQEFSAPLSNYPYGVNCKRSEYVICKLHVSDIIKFESCRTKEMFTVREKDTCDSNNVIYPISCKK